MASALRELIATFKIDYDPKGAKQADQALDRIGVSAKKAQAKTSSLSTSLKGLGLILGARELARGFMGIVTAASDVDETLNVLDVSFGDSAAAVKDFAKVTADEIGRSEFMLREFAGTIGAVVTPMLQSLGPEAEGVSAKISQDFSKLAVDLASMYNAEGAAGEANTLEALRSGLTGQSEPLLKFGVVALQQNVADFAGISVGEFGKLDQAAKVLHRYRFIMQQTARAQGDAERTGDGFANMTRRLGGQLNTIAVVIGRKILPSVNRWLKRFSDFIQMMIKAKEQTSIFEAAMFSAIAAMTLFGVRAAWAGRVAVRNWILATLPALAMGAAVLFIVLAIEDLITGLQGGDSYFADFIDWLTNSTGGLERWQETIDDAIESVFNMFDSIGKAFDTFLEDWAAGFKAIVEAPKEAFASLMDLLPNMGETGTQASLMLNAPETRAALPTRMRRDAAAPHMSLPASTNSSTNNNQMITLNISAPGGGKEPARDIAREVKKVLREERRGTVTGM